MEATSSVKMNVRSGIWEYFSIVGSDKTKAKCLQCGTTVSRGRNLQKLTNSSMIHHLSSKHPDNEKNRKDKESKETQRKRKLEEEATMLEKTKRQRLTQPTLSDMKDKTKIWDINDPKSQKITRLIGKSISHVYC